MLQLGGIDLVDHTPVFDIKPYLPYCEALPDALGGFALTPPDRVAVVVDEGVREAFDALPERSRQVIREVLACDPRPAAGSGGEGRVFGVRMCGHDLRFVMAAGECRVVGIKRSDASGLSEPLVRRSIQLGISKFNVNTELRQACLCALRESLHSSPSTDLPDLMQEAVTGMSQVVSVKLHLFGSVGAASVEPS